MAQGIRLAGVGGSGSDNLRGALFMMGGMAAFTLGDAVSKALLQMLPQFQAITLRGLITIPLLLLLLHRSGLPDWSPVRAGWRLLGLRTMAEALSTVTFFAALQAMPLGNLSAILQSAPLMITLAAAIFLGEKVGWRRMLAIAVGFVGVLLIVRPDADGLSSPALLGLGTVLCVVVRDLVTRRMSTAIPAVMVALLTSLVVTLMSALLSMGQGWQPVPHAAWPLLLGGACCVIAGYIMMVRVMQIGEVGAIMPFRYTALIWALLLGWLIWDEFPDAVTLTGAAIVIGSGAYTLLREARLARGGK